VTMAKTFFLSCHGFSDVGLVRTNNEDSWIASPDERVFLLADGLGGHQAGEVASREAIDSFLQVFRTFFSTDEMNSELDIIRALRACFVRTNKHLFTMACEHELLHGMGTTFCALSFHDDKVAISHVGDSRIYLLRNSQFEQLTRDHCWTRRYGISPSEMRCKGVLTRALGTNLEVEPTIRLLRVCVGDRFLLCSDGLSDMLSSKEIEEAMRKPMTIGQRVRMLVSRAKKNGGADNITVILVEVQDGKNLS